MDNPKSPVLSPNHLYYSLITNTRCRCLILDTETRSLLTVCLHSSFRNKTDNIPSQWKESRFTACPSPLSPVLLRWSQAAQPRPRMTRPGGTCQRRSKRSSVQQCCSFRRRGPWRALRPRNFFALVSPRSSFHFLSLLGFFTSNVRALVFDKMKLRSLSLMDYCSIPSVKRQSTIIK